MAEAPRSPTLGSGSRSVGPSPVVNRPDPGRNFRQAAEVVQGLGEKIQQQRVQQDQIRLAQAEQRARTRLEQEVRELDPSDPNFLQQVEETTQRVRRDVLDDSGLQTNEARQELQVRLQAFGEQQQRSAIAQRDQEIQRQAVQQGQEIVQSQVDAIRQNPNAAPGLIKEMNARLSDLGGTLPESQVEELANDARAQATNARIIGLQEQGAFDAARQVADSAGDVLSPEQIRARKQQINNAEQELQNERVAANEGQVQALQTQLTKATTPEGLTAFQDQLERAQQRGVFEERRAQLGQLRRMAIRKRQQFQRQQQTRQKALSKMKVGIGLDTKSEKEEAYALLRERRDLQSAEDETDLTREFVDRTGTAPPQIRTRIENIDRGGGGTDELAFAAQQYDAIKAGSEQVGTGALDSGSRVRMVSEARRLFGMNYQDAASFVNNSMPDEGQLAKRREEFNNQVLQDGFDAQDFTREAVRGAEGFPVLGEDAFIPKPIEQRAERAFQTAFELTGDKERARKFAQREIGDSLSVSRVSGQPVVTEAAPEAIVESPRAEELRASGEADVISETIRRDVTDVVQQQDLVSDEARELADEQNAPAVRLVATDETLRSLRRGNREDAQWEIRVMNDLGVYTSVELDNGDTLKYSPPTGSEFDQHPAIKSIVREERREVQRQNEPQGPVRGQPQGPGSGAAQEDIPEGEVTVGPVGPAGAGGRGAADENVNDGFGGPAGR